MKKVEELLIIIEDIAPNLKSSEKLFICDLVLNEQLQAYKEGGIKALTTLKGLTNAPNRNK